ncbi:MAG: hypothetical protein JNM17_38220 [Archangium sp.]|nr:hypothetical protein [Archangium sp.]
MLRFATLALALSSLPVLADDKPSGGSDTPSSATFRQSGALLDRNPQKRNMMISVFVGFPYGYYYYGFPFGVGGRFLIPILHDGFIPPVNDSFGIEFGADLSGVLGAYFYPTIGLPVEVYWQFHFTSKFSAYAKAGVVIEFNPVPYTCNGNGICRGYVSASPIGNLGLIYKFSEKVSFRAEAGYPWIKVGLGFDL